MINFFRLILKILTGNVKIYFKNPSHYDYILFDDSSIVDFKYILKSLNYFPLKVRLDKIEYIYCSFEILRKIINYLKFFNYSKNSIYTCYLISLIEIINPRIVMSNIDNSLKYSDIINFYQDKKNKIKFLTIQNAARYDVIINDLYYKKNFFFKNINKKFFIQNFLCFGKYEIDLYKKYDITVKNFYTVGSLCLANFLQYIKENKIKIKKNLYKLSVLAEVPLDIIGVKNNEYAFVQVIKFTIQYCQKNNISPKFVWKSDDITDQINIYEKYLPAEDIMFIRDNVILRKNKNYTSYMTIFQSEVLIGMASTLLREKLSLGEKVLCCNFSGSKVWEFPIKGICYIEKSSYKIFEKKLDKILIMNSSEYIKKLKKKSQFLMVYNKNLSTIDKIKKIIRD
jgi:hypothetical protein